VRIRNFRLGDYAQVLEIWATTGLNGDGENLDALARQLSWDSELVLVAEKDERIIGVIMGSVDGDKAYFYRLAVLPEYQRMGVGQQLVKELEERFRSRGASEVVIMVNSQSPLPFYHSLGYKVKPLVTLSKPIV
jgi:ribosomal protein S18 acetylase RimI-like enzyme